MCFWLILGGRHTATKKDTNLMDVFMFHFLVDLPRPEVDVVGRTSIVCYRKFQVSIFREYLLINEKKHPVHKNF